MTGITLIDSESSSDHIPIMTSIKTKPLNRNLGEVREVIKKDVDQTELMEELLYKSDWPRIPFNKCWQMKKYLFTPKEGKPLTRIKIVERALRAI